MSPNINGKRLLVLGGMRISCEIVEKAQELGIHVIVADYNNIEDSPGKQIADEAVDLSVTDVSAVVSYIKENRIDGVFVGFNDMLLPFYAAMQRNYNPFSGTFQPEKLRFRLCGQAIVLGQ